MDQVSPACLYLSGCVRRYSDLLCGIGVLACHRNLQQSGAAEDMIHFRYEAKTPFGIPIYGTEYAESEPHLRAKLAQRQLVLVQCSQLRLDSALVSSSNAIPRAIELRVGERLREAVLSGIPAHEAVRALAYEPMEHPLVSMLPSMFITTVCLILPALLWGFVFPSALLTIVLIAGLVLSLEILSWIGGWLLFVVRPRRLLLGLSTQLEQGQVTLFEGGIGFQPEINAVLRSSISNDQKARAVADLLPALQGGRFFHNQLFLNVLGVYLLTSAFALGGYWVMAYVIPRYRDIYDGFALSLPVMTSSLIRFSNLFEKLGAGGLISLILLTGGGLLCLSLLFGTRFASDYLASIPIIGRNASMLMQARVARVIAALLRHDCDRPDAVRAATSATVSSMLRAEGQFVAAGLEKAGLVPGQLKMMSALPMSLLMSRSTEESGREAHASRISKNFSAIADMLEKACQGRSLFLIMLFQTGLTLVMSVFVGLTVIALFIPLLKLLNDLA